MVEDAKVAGEGRQDSASSQVEAAFGAVEGAVGLGVDIVEIERMRKILKRSPAFARKVFSAEECRYCDAAAQPAVHYATRFAAKEAVLKALGTGFSQGIGVRDVEVRRTSKGRPYAVLTGRARQVAQALGVRELPLSLSYTHTDAVACAMAITEGSVRAQQERRDPMEELARQFKEARTMLDDLDAAAPAPVRSPRCPMRIRPWAWSATRRGRPIRSGATRWRSWRAGSRRRAPCSTTWMRQRLRPRSPRCPMRIRPWAWSAMRRGG